MRERDPDLARGPPTLAGCFRTRARAIYAPFREFENFGAGTRARTKRTACIVSWCTIEHRALVFARVVRVFCYIIKMFNFLFISRFLTRKPLSMQRAWSGAHAYAKKSMIYQDIRFSDILVYQFQTRSDDSRDDRQSRHVNKTALFALSLSALGSGFSPSAAAKSRCC